MLCMAFYDRKRNGLVSIVKFFDDKQIGKNRNDDNEFSE